MPRSIVDLLLIALVIVAILFPFVVIPEILERWGYDTRGRFVRIVVLLSLLLLVLVPAALLDSWPS